MAAARNTTKAMTLGQYPEMNGSRAMTGVRQMRDRKSTRLNSSHLVISYAVFCLKKKNTRQTIVRHRTAYRPYATIARRIDPSDVCTAAGETAIVPSRTTAAPSY